MRAATYFFKSFASFSAILALVRLACSLVDAKERSPLSLVIVAALEVAFSYKRDWS
jgi:hypothetical protein